MTFSAKERVFLVECYLTTKYIKTTLSDYSHIFGNPTPANFVIFTFGKEFKQTANANVPKHERSSTLVSETRMSGVRERLTASPHMSTRKVYTTN
jgi:hypothetical protein